MTEGDNTELDGILSEYEPIVSDTCKHIELEGSIMRSIEQSLIIELDDPMTAENAVKVFWNE